MTTFNTGNPLGSTDVYDRYDNSENLDNFSNGPLDAYPDRFGVPRQSWAGMEAEFDADQVDRAAQWAAFLLASGYQVLGPYGAGLVFTAPNQLFSYLGEFYAPGPSITLPYTTTGVGAAEIANFRSVGDAVLRQDLAGPSGAALSNHNGRTVDKFLDDWANVRAEGATGDGVTVDKTNCQAAINTGKNVYFPAGQYQLGTADTGAFLTASADGQIFFFDAGAVLLASGNNGVFNDAATLLIDGKKNVTVIGFKAIGSLNVDDEQRDSPWGIVIKCTSADCLNTTIIGAYAENTQGLLLTVKSNMSNAFEVTGVTVDGYSQNSYYGLNCAQTGNGISGRIQTLNNHRAYFAYGCYGHDIDVIDNHDGTKLSSFLAQSQIAAVSYTGSVFGKDTHSIKLRYHTKGSTYSGNRLQLTKSVTLGDSVAPVIYDVEIDYNDRGSLTPRSIGFANFVNGAPQAGITGRAFDNITLTGYSKNPFDLTHGGFTAAVNQSPQGLCNLEGLRMDATPTGVYDPHNGLLFDEGALYGNQKSASFTPRMYGSTTPGGARNGTTHTLQQGTAYKSGRIVTVNMQLAWTATTETGNMRIDTSGLPAEFRPRGLSNYTAVGAIAHQNIDFPGTNGTPGAWAKSGQDWVDLIATTDNAGIGFAVVDAAGEAWITITWETN